MIPFAGFAPDLDPTTPGVITESLGVVPTLRGYSGGSLAVDIGMNTLADDALSADSMFTLSGSIRTFAGSATKLYEKNGAAWVNVSRATSVYNASASNIWRFAQFGETILAVNKGDKLQAFTGAAFADLAAPTARVMCVWRGFVVLADTTDGGSGQTFGDSPFRWWTSAYLDHTSWTPSIATQCTTGQLVDTPGRIAALKVLGESLIAYKETAIYVGRDAGSPTVLQFTKLPGEIGCASQEAIVDIGGAHIFIGKNDIYMFDGNSVKSIGAPLRMWFFRDLDIAYASRIRALHDEFSGLVYFNYPRIGSGGALNNGMIIYNYRADKWGYTNVVIKTPFEYIAGGYRYDNLPIEGRTYADWPLISYDDPFWDANRSYVAFFASDNKVYAIAGSGGPSSITTGAYGQESFYTLLQRVTLRYLQKPLLPTTMTHYYANDLGGTWTQGQTVMESNGRFDLLHSAPWHRVRFNFTNQFEAIGMDADFQPDGEL